MRSDYISRWAVKQLNYNESIKSHFPEMWNSSCQVSRTVQLECLRSNIVSLLLLAELQEIDACCNKLTYLSMDNEDEFTDEIKQCEEYENKLTDSIKLVKNAIADFNINLGNNAGGSILASPNTQDRIGSQIKLPALPMPVYSNAESENLEVFFAPESNLKLCDISVAYLKLECKWKVIWKR